MLLKNSHIPEAYIQAKYSQDHAEAWKRKQIDLISEHSSWLSVL